MNLQSRHCVPQPYVRWDLVEPEVRDYIVSTRVNSAEFVDLRIMYNEQDLFGSVQSLSCQHLIFIRSRKLLSLNVQ